MLSALLDTLSLRVPKTAAKRPAGDSPALKIACSSRDAQQIEYSGFVRRPFSARLAT
jgi:hypothetical protein